MLRLLRPRGNILSLGARINPAKPKFSHSQPEVVRIQRVKFKKRRPKIRDILIFAGVNYALFEGFTRALIALVDEEDLEITEQERQELDERAAKPYFIPFPGFTQMIEPLPYRGGDPEWKAYVKVSRDRELLASVRGSVAEMARHAITRDPVLTKKWGKDATISKHWLDIQYPLMSPPTFVRQGLSFGGGDGIAWAKRPVNSTAVFWTRQALWPSAVSISVWSFTSALVKQNFMMVKKFFGYETQADSVLTTQQAMERVQRGLKNQLGKSSAFRPPPPSQGQTGDRSTTSPFPPVDERAAGTTRTPETMSTGPSADNTPETVPKAKDMSMIRTTQEHTNGPWASFWQSLAKRWRAPRDYPPSGSIRVSGLVEVETSRAIMTVDCVAWWDPQTKKFDQRTLFLSLRAVRPKVQSPLR
ncbi:hypothetical protein F4801DRAFT_586670 [Xylaria longipes]|nr:hypothetical protein F4801DRAFT_586670 [Xylaria longipes]